MIAIDPELRRIEGSSFVEKVVLTRFNSDAEAPMHPDGCWDFAIIKSRQRVCVLRTGITTRTVVCQQQAGDEILAISFKPGTFMPQFPGQRMVDHAVVLESSGACSFRLGSTSYEIPNFDNADVFVEHLVRDGLISRNRTVESILKGDSRRMSERTLQRHFLATMGITYKRFTMLERAQNAVTLLRMGRSSLDVAHALGYFDQAHLINSLRAIVGQTPGQIQELDRQ